VEFTKFFRGKLLPSHLYARSVLKHYAQKQSMWLMLHLFNQDRYSNTVTV